jgi:hypothetical protein
MYVTDSDSGWVRSNLSCVALFDERVCNLRYDIAWKDGSDDNE